MPVDFAVPRLVFVLSMLYFTYAADSGVLILTIVGSVSSFDDLRFRTAISSAVSGLTANNVIIVGISSSNDVGYIQIKFKIQNVASDSLGSYLGSLAYACTSGQLSSISPKCPIYQESGTSTSTTSSSNGTLSGGTLAIVIICIIAGVILIVLACGLVYWFMSRAEAQEDAIAETAANVTTYDLPDTLPVAKEPIKPEVIPVIARPLTPAPYVPPERNFTHDFPVRSKSVPLYSDHSETIPFRESMQTYSPSQQNIPLDYSKFGDLFPVSPPPQPVIIDPTENAPYYRQYFYDGGAGGGSPVGVLSSAPMLFNVEFPPSPPSPTIVYSSPGHSPIPSSFQVHVSRPQDPGDWYKSFQV